MPRMVPNAPTIVAVINVRTMSKWLGATRNTQMNSREGRSANGTIPTPGMMNASSSMIGIINTVVARTVVLPTAMAGSTPMKSCRPPADFFMKVAAASDTGTNACITMPDIMGIKTREVASAIISMTMSTQKKPAPMPMSMPMRPPRMAGSPMTPNFSWM